MSTLSARPLRLSLGHALIVFVIAPLLLTIGAIGWFALNTLEHQAQQRMRKDIQLIAQTLQPPLEHALQRDRPGAIQEALDATFTFGEVYGAHVFDEHGRLIAGAGAGDRALSLARLVDLARTGKRAESQARVDGEALYVYFLPLTDMGGRIAALLQITRPGSDFATALSRIRVLGGSALAILAIILTAIVLAGHRWGIGNPVRSLSTSMTQVGQGALDHRARASGPQEIRALAYGFNDMLDRIQSSEREIARREAIQAELEADLRHSRKLAAVGALAAGVAHELGTPLTVIAGRARQTLRRSPPDPATRSAMEAVGREVERMSAIVRQLLDFAHRSPLEKRPVRVDRLLQSAAARVEDLRADTGTRLRVLRDTASVSVAVDRPRMEQALINLLRNALQAAPGGEVRIGWSARRDAIELFVEDDGPGVTESARQRAFEPFFTTKPVGSGTGLGLSVTHGVVHDHGGEIRIEDSPLGGARFVVALPGPAPEARDAA